MEHTPKVTHAPIKPMSPSPDAATAASERAPWELRQIQAGNVGTVIMEGTLATPIIMSDASSVGQGSRFPHSPVAK